jgi:acylphosphatase
MEVKASTVRATVKGYVQGVGFRVFVRSAAWRLHLKGFVRNMPDGTLQVVASGPRQSLEKLLSEMWRGPAGAQVHSVDTQWEEGEAAGVGQTFEVRL